MRNDYVIKSLRKTLHLNEKSITHILELAGYRASRAEIANALSDNDELPDAGDEMMAHFLDGLIFFQRGKSDKHPPQPVRIPVTNNMILKKLRVAFTLREDDILAILKSQKFRVNKPELSALFRSEGHKNYRECGDQLLRYFLRGLGSRKKGSG